MAETTSDYSRTGNGIEIMFSTRDFNFFYRDTISLKRFDEASATMPSLDHHLVYYNDLLSLCMTTTLMRMDLGETFSKGVDRECGLLRYGLKISLETNHVSHGVESLILLLKKFIYQMR